MNIIRFSDLCAQGKVAGKRVFIRADLNVPLRPHAPPLRGSLPPEGAQSGLGRPGAGPNDPVWEI